MICVPLTYIQYIHIDRSDRVKSKKMKIFTVITFPVVLQLLLFILSTQDSYSFHSSQRYSMRSSSTSKLFLKNKINIDETPLKRSKSIVNKERIPNKKKSPVDVHSSSVTKPWFKQTAIKIIGNSLMFIGLTMIPLAAYCEKMS